jgi:hypothetical protein
LRPRILAHLKTSARAILIDRNALEVAREVIAHALIVFAPDIQAEQLHDRLEFKLNCNFVWHFHPVPNSINFAGV